MKHALPQRSCAPPGAWEVLTQKYWRLTREEAWHWWRAVMQATDAETLGIRQAVLLYDATDTLIEPRHLLFHLCQPSRMIESIEHLVSTGLLRRGEASRWEEHLLAQMDCDGQWR